MARLKQPSNALGMILVALMCFGQAPAALAETAEAATLPPVGKTTETLRIERLNRPKVFSDIVYNEQGQLLDVCMPAETNTAQVLPMPKTPSKPQAKTTAKALVKPLLVKSSPLIAPSKSSSAKTLPGAYPNRHVKKTALIFVHGGNFKAGNKELMLPYCKLFAQAGFLSISVNYRLAPIHPFPAGQNDVQDAVKWMQSHAGRYGFDPKRVVLVGYSAGGNLALMASTRINMEHRPKKQPAASPAQKSKASSAPVRKPALAIPKPVASDVPALAPVAGVIALATPTNFETLLSAVPQFQSDVYRYLDGENLRNASPLYTVTSKSPPMLLIHGQQDKLVPVSQSRELLALLQDLKVPARLLIYPGMDHNVFSPNPQLSQMLRDMTSFIVHMENRDIR